MKAIALIEAMEDAEPLLPFAKSPTGPTFEPKEERKLARHARSAVPSLVRRLRSESAGQRHAAAYLLGLSGDVRAVRPLFALVVDPRDWYDQDYATAALARLGKTALPHLGKRAIAGDVAEAELALRAIADSRADTLATLRRIRDKRRTAPEGLYAAYSDPRGLPDLIEALGDSSSQDEALAAAEEILCNRGSGRASLSRRREWSVAFAELVDSDDLNVRAQALVCIGRLKDQAQLPVLVGALADIEDDVVAAAVGALAHLGSDESEAELVALLSHRALSKRSLAAATLLDAGLARGATKKRAVACLVEAATGVRGGWLRERTILTVERHRMATTALVAAMKKTRGPSRRRGANALVEVARLKKRPSAAIARMRKNLRGEARAELDRAWAAHERSEARIQKELERIRRSDFPRRSRPRGGL